MGGTGRSGIVRRLLMAGGCAALLAAPALAQRSDRTGQGDLARLLAGRVAGKPVNCIDLNTVRSTRVIPRIGIVYDMGRTIYVNRPRSGAESLRRDDILLTRTSSGQLCSTDAVRLVGRGSNVQRGFVALGQFVPYVRERR